MKPRPVPLLLLVGAALVLGLARPSCAQGAAAAPPPAEQGIFPDVSLRHWASKAVDVLAAHGVFTGYPDQKYHGDRAITRYEVAVAFQRLLRPSQMHSLAEGAPAPLHELFGRVFDPSRSLSTPQTVWLNGVTSGASFIDALYNPAALWASDSLCPPNRSIAILLEPGP